MARQAVGGHRGVEVGPKIFAFLGALDHGWNSFALDGRIDDGELAERIEDSYALVVARLPRSQRP